MRSRLAGFPPVRFAYRTRILWRDRALAGKRPGDALRWLFRSREVSNFTYELANEDEIPALLGSILGRPEEELAGYLAELRADEELTASLRKGLKRNRKRDPDPRLGKRRLIYCAVRAERPRLVVESGVHDGLGTVVILRALRRNAEDGDPGELLGFDINPDAGWLVDAVGAPGNWTLEVGDVRKRLEPALSGRRVDLFIQDSLKTLEYESFELETAAAHAGSRLLLYSDDASVTGAISRVCERRGGRSATLRELPLDHYWRGNLLGLCLLETTPGAPARKRRASRT
jgi:hypothetical protein